MPNDLTDSDDVDHKIEAAELILENTRRLLAAALDAAGGRGVDLANKLDRVSLALDALKGDLYCSQCEAQLTSP